MPAQLARVPRTLLGWLVELVVMRLPGMAILNKLGEAGAEGLVREPEHKVEIATLQWRKADLNAWQSLLGILYN